MKTDAPPLQNPCLNRARKAMQAQIADTAQALLSAIELLAQLDGQLGLLRKTVERVQQSHLDALDYLEMTALMAEEDSIDKNQAPPQLQDCAPSDDALAWSPWQRSLSLPCSVSPSMHSLA